MVEGINFAMTTMPTILLWVIGLVVFGVGAFLGYVNMNIDARKKIDAAENNAQIIRTEAEKKLEEAKKLGGAVETPSLLRIKNDNVGMVVEMDGKILSAPLSAEGKKRLLELISVFRPFIDGQTQQPVAKPVVTQTPSASLTMPPPVSVTANKSSPQAEVKPVSILNPGQPKKLDPEKEFALLSIVQQIDTVLQKKLANTPLEDGGIRLLESSQGSVEVQVGLQKYDSIDEVPDEKIKLVIRNAIAEWESKYVPGM